MIPLAIFAQKKAKDLSLKNRLKLYKTEDMNTMLELDTRTGVVKQIHWALKSDEEKVYTINPNDLSESAESGPNVFELYATNNMYQFILINKVNGNKWHIQWGEDKDHRWIRKIKQ